MELEPIDFQKNLQALREPNMDLFASRISHKTRRYMSWKPDPMSVATDALTQDWSNLFPYAFPPFCLVGRTLKKAQKHLIQMIIITPVWVSQPWYPVLLEMCIQSPILLPKQRYLLENPRKETHPLIENNSLSLAAWFVSGNRGEQARYRQQLPLLSKTPKQWELEKITSRPGESFVAGVVQDRLIQFLVL